MNHVRLIGSGAALAVALAGTSLAGRGSSATSPAARSAPFDSLHFRSDRPRIDVGPHLRTSRSTSRIRRIFYVATAHGGVWKTTNNGTTFEAQFQDQGLMSIGDVTVSQSNPDLVWIGTGESNNRQSTSWGDGVYKSTDGGKTWTHMGLRALAPHQSHRDRPAQQRHRSSWRRPVRCGAPAASAASTRPSDGGTTWKQVLKVDDDTGANDLVMDPTDSKVLYASTYQRRRTACCMNGGGPGSGIWKSTDGGEHVDEAEGRRARQPLGRIALDVYRRRPNILYALIEGPAQPGAAAAAPGAAPRRGAAPAAAQSERSHRSLSLRRRRRHLAEGQQREPAADVLQPGHGSIRTIPRLSISAASISISRSTAARR